MSSICSIEAKGGNGGNGGNSNLTDGAGGGGGGGGTVIIISSRFLNYDETRISTSGGTGGLQFGGGAPVPTLASDGSAGYIRTFDTVGTLTGE